MSNLHCVRPIIALSALGGLAACSGEDAAMPSSQPFAPSAAVASPDAVQDAGDTAPAPAAPAADSGAPTRTIPA